MDRQSDVIEDTRYDEEHCGGGDDHEGQYEASHVAEATIEDHGAIVTHIMQESGCPTYALFVECGYGMG